MNDPTLDALRADLAEVDRRLIEAVAERQLLAARIGRHKAERGLATRDYRQEKEVLDRVRRAPPQSFWGEKITNFGDFRPILH